jgi:hypothetical protein
MMDEAELGGAGLIAGEEPLPSDRRRFSPEHERRTDGKFKRSPDRPISGRRRQ